MRAVSVVQADSNYRLEINEVPEPEAGPGQVLLRVAASGVNRADLYQAKGHYPPPAGASQILGLECSGTIVALGENVHEWQLDDQVCALLAGGGYAEYVAVDACSLFPVPNSIRLRAAAALPEATCTAWSNLDGVADLHEGQSVLIHGGSGGLGSMAIQLANELGARVYATAGSQERAKRCLELGAEEAWDYHSFRADERINLLTDGLGVDVVFDVIGGDALDQNLRSLAVDGTLLIVGAQGGGAGQLDIGRLMNRRLRVAGTTLRNRPLAQKREIVRSVLDDVWPWIDDEDVRPVIHAKLPAERAMEAHRMLNGHEVFGKILLTWS